MTLRSGRLALAACLLIPFGAAVAAAPPEPARTPTAVQINQQTEALVRKAGQAWLRREWDEYKARFIADGRVVDNANGGKSHSEGQGYALLLATMMQDKPGFEAIWAWTDAHLFKRSDALAAWSWDGKAAATADKNNATDGDLLIAWALARAATAFGQPAYTERARAMAEAVGRILVVKTDVGPVLLPGAFGFAAADQPDGPVLNLSYYVFPALDALKPLTPDVDWDGLKATGLRLIEASRFGPLRLPSDWVSIAGANPRPAAGFAKTFGYDAIRIPLYLAWAGLPQAGKARFAALWNPNPDLGPFVVDVDTGAAVRPLEGAGFKLIAALSACLARKDKLPPALIQSRDALYYPATLRLLCLALIEERYPQCL